MSDLMTATTGGEVQQSVEIGTEQEVITENSAPSTETQQQTTTEPTEKMLTQSEVDNIIRDRLARERQKFETETKTAAQQARDNWIAEQGYEWHGKPITTEAEYKQALKEQELENKIRQQYSNVPDELLNEIVEGKRFREETLAEKKAREEKKAENKQYSDFLEAYPDVKAEEIPVEVWKEVKEGRNLTDAYTRYENKRLKDEMAKFQQQQQTQQANNQNAAASTGSVRTSGKTEGFISQEEFDANKHNTNWVRRNLNTIEESRKRW